MSLLDDVKQRLDIVDVVSRYVTLTPAGRSFKARCPFHTERTPSFTVSPERQTWHCFGACATGGDAVTFVMKMEKLGFPEALRLLAQQAGVALPVRRSEVPPSPLLQVNEAAARFYHQHLLSHQGTQAREYLEGRGVSPEATETFLLGLGLPGWDSLKGHLAGLGFSEEVMLRAGLLHASPDGRTGDLFRGRLLFPIRNAGAQVVGFGGRSLDGSAPKYLNTPQTPLFDKGRLLYGLDAAAEVIRGSGQGVIVEGYMDALMAHQHGFRNVVASMGTALTRHQVELLVGLGRSFVLALDPDAAGQEATLRSLEGSWGAFHPPSPRQDQGAAGGRPGLLGRRPQVVLRVAVLPSGLDPDELIRQDPQAWAQTVEGAPHLLDFLLEVLPSRYDLTSPAGRLQLAERVGGLLLAEEDPGQQDRYLERLERLLGVDRRTLDEALGLRRRALLAQARPGPPARVQGSTAAFTRATGDPLEEYILALLLRYSSLKDLPAAGSQAARSFQRGENRELFTQWALCPTIERLRDIVDPSLHHHLDALLAYPLPPMDLKERQEALAWSLRRLEERALRELKAQEGVVMDSIKGDTDQEAEVLATALERNRRLHWLVTGEGAQEERGDSGQEAPLS